MKLKNISMSSVFLILYALIVLWNQSIGNPYGLVIAWGGLIVGIILILEVLFRKTNFFF